MKTNHLSTGWTRLMPPLLMLTLWGCLPHTCQAQLGAKMTPKDLVNAANKSVTADDMGKQSVTLAANGQAIGSSNGKYGIMFWNVPVYEVYLSRLANNIDLMISTLNTAYPQRQAVIEKVWGVSVNLTYGWHASAGVGTQTGKAVDMSEGARQKFLASLLQALNIDFYMDSFSAMSESGRIQFFNDRLETAAYASGQHYIAEYPPSSGEKNTRIHDTAVSCMKVTLDMLGKNSVASAISQVGTVIGQTTPNSVDVNNLFRSFNAVKQDKYWKLLSLGSSVGLMLKQIPGATLATDVTSNEGIGSRYADETLLPDKLYPSPLALQTAKSPSGANFSGLGTITVKQK